MLKKFSQFCLRKNIVADIILVPFLWEATVKPGVPKGYTSEVKIQKGYKGNIQCVKAEWRKLAYCLKFCVPLSYFFVNMVPNSGICTPGPKFTIPWEKNRCTTILIIVLVHHCIMCVYLTHTAWSSLNSEAEIKSDVLRYGNDVYIFSWWLYMVEGGPTNAARRDIQGIFWHGQDGF